MDYLGACGLGSWIGTFLLRNKMRQTLHIEGSKADDCFKSFCCKPCAICQMWGQLDPDFDPDDSDDDRTW